MTFRLHKFFLLIGQFTQLDARRGPLSIELNGLPIKSFRLRKLVLVVEGRSDIE